MDWKKYLEIAAVSIVATAIVFRISAVRHIVTGVN